jgi:hypothetical protein
MRRTIPSLLGKVNAKLIKASTGASDEHAEVIMRRNGS